MRLNITNKLLSQLGNSGAKVMRDVSLANITSFGIGGPADLLIRVETPEQIRSSLRTLANEEIPIYVLGSGTNVLISDKGFVGAIIKPVSRRLEPLRLNGFSVGSGRALRDVLDVAAKSGFSGGEDLIGIPGSVGGCIAMNAGAWGASISDILRSVLVFDMNGDEIDIDLQSSFEYRGFKYREKSVIAQSEIVFNEIRSPIDILEKMKEIEEKRASTQPIRERSAGCIFKNPPDDHAGRLIEAVGLKGFSFRGAKISEIHANFMVNSRNAKASDIQFLIDEVIRKVYQEFDIELELEIIKLGF